MYGKMWQYCTVKFNSYDFNMMQKYIVTKWNVVALSRDKAENCCAHKTIVLSKLRWSQWEMRPPKSSVSLQKYWPRAEVYHVFMNSAASAACCCRQVISFQLLDRSKTALPVLSSGHDLCRWMSCANRGEGKRPTQVNYLSARKAATCF